MKNKAKLISTIVAFCFIAAFCVFQVFALSDLIFESGGSVTFITNGLEFSVGKGRFEKTNNETYPDVLENLSTKMLPFTMAQNTVEEDIETEMMSWTELDMTMTEVHGDCVMVIPVTNNMTDRILGVEITASIPEGATNVNDNVQFLVQSGTVNARSSKEFKITFDIKSIDIPASISQFDIQVYFSEASEDVEMTVDTVMVGGTAVSLDKTIYETGEPIELNQNVMLPADKTTDITLNLSNTTDKEMKVVLEHTAPNGVTVVANKVVLQPYTKQEYVVSVSVPAGQNVDLADLGLSVRLKQASILYDTTIPGNNDWGVDIVNGEAQVRYNGPSNVEVTVPNNIKTTEGTYPVTVFDGCASSVRDTTIILHEDIKRANRVTSDWDSSSNITFVITGETIIGGWFCEMAYVETIIFEGNAILMEYDEENGGGSFVDPSGIGKIYIRACIQGYIYFSQPREVWIENKEFLENNSISVAWFDSYDDYYGSCEEVVYISKDIDQYARFSEYNGYYFEKDTSYQSDTHYKYVVKSTIYDATQGSDWIYDIVNEEAQVKYNGSETEVTVPHNIKTTEGTYPVTVFNGWRSNLRDTTIILHEDIRRVNRVTSDWDTSSNITLVIKGETLIGGWFCEMGYVETIIFEGDVILTSDDEENGGGSFVDPSGIGKIYIRGCVQGYIYFSQPKEVWIENKEFLENNSISVAWFDFYDDYYGSCEEVVYISKDIDQYARFSEYNGYYFEKDTSYQSDSHYKYVIREI